MAKLYAEITSDKGVRVVGKGGNEYVTITTKEKNRNMFEITFIATEHACYIDVLRYSDGTTTRLHYIDIDIPT